MTFGEQIGQSAIGMGLGLGSSLIGQGLQQNQQNYFNEQQVQNQMRLTRFNQEMAIRMWKETGPKAQMEQLLKAGLSPGLMFSKGGGGGGISAVTPGNAPGGNADRPNPIEGMAMMANVRLANAQADMAEAQAEKAKQETETISKSRDYLIENMKQSGIGQWFENLKNKFLREGYDPYAVTVLKNEVYGTQAKNYDELSPEVKKFQVDLALAEAQSKNLDATALLTNEKAKGYWQEMMIAQQNADQDGIKAAAIKLASEWTTGEFTNWKTWVELGKNAIDTVSKLIK